MWATQSLEVAIANTNLKRRVMEAQDEFLPVQRVCTFMV